MTRRYRSPHPRLGITTIRAAGRSPTPAIAALLTVVITGSVLPSPAAWGDCPEPAATRDSRFDLDPCAPVGIKFVDKIIIDKLVNGVCKVADVSCSASCRNDIVHQGLFTGVTLDAPTSAAG